MQSLSYVAASNGVANASLMTVQTARAKNATSIITNTVANAPQAFYATMGTPHTFTDPVTGETITIISEATAVDFAGHLLSGHVEIDAIAPGYTDNGSAVGDIIIIRPNTEWANNIFNILSQSLQDNGALKTTALDAMYRPGEISPNSFVASGGIIAQTTLLTASFSDIVYYIGGLRYTKTGVAPRIYTASKDTHVDINAAGVLTYSEVANNAASPALAAGNIRLGIVVTSATTITSVRQAGVDTIPNPVYPTGAINGNNINASTMNWYAFRAGVVNTAAAGGFGFTALNGGITASFPAVLGATYEIMISSSYMAPTTNAQVDLAAQISSGGTIIDAITTSGAAGIPISGRIPWTAPSTGTFTITGGVIVGGAGQSIRTDNFMITVRRLT